MKSLLLRFENKKYPSVFFGLIIGGMLSYWCLNLDLMPIKTWLGWLLGVGILGIVLLHVKSLFMDNEKDLGFYYSRLYGFCFTLIYTTIIFMIIISLVGKVALENELVFLTAIFSMSFYSFLLNNYASLRQSHLIGKNLMDKKKNN